MLAGLDKEIEEFIRLLEKQNQALKTLITLQEEKRPIIILGKIEELNRLLPKEGIIVSNLEKLEDARFKLHLKLAQRWEMSVKELPARLILAKVKECCPEWSEKMESIVEQLEKNLFYLKTTNNNNNDLLNQSLEYVNTMQAILNGDVAGTYSDSGTQVDESSSRPIKRLLDKKI